jgi:large subunit ribosomal protein L5
MEENIMRKIRIQKVILNCGATGDQLEKGAKLLNTITSRIAKKMKSKKRIPSLGVRPGLEVGCIVTLRGKIAEQTLKRLFGAVNNQIKEKQIKENHFSFGIQEYIEIPNMEYVREIGMLGLEVTVVFSRAGRRVKLKKIKKGKYPRKQAVSKEEIIQFMEQNFNVEIR